MFISTYHVQNSLRIYGSQITVSPHHPHKLVRKLRERPGRDRIFWMGIWEDLIKENLLELGFQGTEQIPADLD